jgi:prevent-host-death family protein
MAEVHNMHDAKTNLSRLAERAAGGAEIVIARNGRPLAKLVPIEARKPLRLGLAKGEIWMSDEFDDPLPREIQKYFEGEGD